MEDQAAYSVALNYAVEKRNLNLAKELLKAGADVDNISMRDKKYYYRGLSPIVFAVRNDDLEMVKLLMEYKPDVDDDYLGGGRLPLVVAAQNGNLEIAKALLGHPNIIVNARESSHYFALALASGNGDYALVELLVNHGEHTRDEYSEALSLASYNGHTGVMRFLMEHGADANHHGNEEFDPPLFEALSRGHWDAARLLMRNGATLEIPISCCIWRPEDGRLQETMHWFSEDTTRTILCLKRLQQQQTGNWEAITHNWDSIVATLWFHYFGPDREGVPPRIRDTARLSEAEFKAAYKWMVHAASSLLFLEEGNMLLSHLCRVFGPSVALEFCNHTGKTPVLLALDAFPCQKEFKRRNAAKGTGLLIEWNPDALQIPDPKTQRIPMTWAIVNRVPLQTLQKMITCKDAEGFTAAPKQQDPVTLLPNILLVAAKKDGYSVSDIYAFSRDFLPDLISSLTSPTRLPRRGTKRRRGQI